MQHFADSVLWVILILGLATWLLALVTKLQLNCVLPLQLRSPVPWRGIDVLIVVGAMIVLGITTGKILEALNDADLIKIPSATFRKILFDHGMGSFVKIATMLFAFFFVRSKYKAKATDFGLDFSSPLRDIGLGVFTFLAILPPVFGLKIFLQYMVRQFSPEIAQQQHKILESLQQNPPTIYWILFSTLVIISAPITEEIFFRGFFQGWLEKLFTRSPFVVSSNKTPGVKPDNSEALEEQSTWDEERNAESHDENLIADDDTSTTNPYAPPSMPDSSNSTLDSTSIPKYTPLEQTENLQKHPQLAWLAILCSSFLFGLMHAGNSLIDPIPLFVWALIVGYIYQRTHRLLPCIVAHALFNSLSILAMAFGVS